MRVSRVLAPVIGVVVSTASAAAQDAEVASGTLVVLNKAEASASLIDLASGEEIVRLPTGVGPHEAVVSADGLTAVVANYGGQTGGNSLTVIDLAGMSVRSTIGLGAHHRPHGLVWLADGRLLVTAEAEQHLLVVDVEAEEVLEAINTDQAVSHMVAATPDGSLAFVANIGSGTMTVIDLEAGAVIKQVTTGAGAEGIDVTPNGNEVWVSNRAADTVSVVNTSTLETLAELKSASFPIRVKVTPDGEFALVSNARTGDVTVFDVDTREEVRRISMGGDDVVGEPTPVGILIPPDGKRAYVANTGAHFVTVIDLSTWEIVGRLRAGQEPDGMAWSAIELVSSGGVEEARP